MDSGISLQIYATAPYFILAPTSEQSALSPPDNKRYCGAVWGIVVFLRNTEAEDNEKLKYNNIGMDMVCLRCHADGTDSIKNVIELVSIITLIKDVHT